MKNLTLIIISLAVITFSCEEENISNPENFNINSRSLDDAITFLIDSEQDQIVDDAARWISFYFYKSENFRKELIDLVIQEDNSVNDKLLLIDVLNKIPSTDPEVYSTELGTSSSFSSLKQNALNYPLLVIQMPAVFQGLIGLRDLNDEEIIFSLIPDIKSNQSHQHLKKYIYDGEKLNEFTVNAKDALFLEIPLVIKESEQLAIIGNEENLTDINGNSLLETDSAYPEDCPCHPKNFIDDFVVKEISGNRLLDVITFNIVSSYLDCTELNGCLIEEENPTTSIVVEEICDNGIDDDMDGFIDEEDYDCCEFYSEINGNCIRDCVDDNNKVVAFRFSRPRMIDALGINVLTRRNGTHYHKFVAYGGDDGLITGSTNPIITSRQHNWIPRGSVINLGLYPNFSLSTYLNWEDYQRYKPSYFVAAWLPRHDTDPSYYDLGIVTVDPHCLYEELEHLLRLDHSLWHYFYYLVNHCQDPINFQTSDKCACVRERSWELKITHVGYCPSRSLDQEKYYTWLEDWDIATGNRVVINTFFEDVLSISGQNQQNSISKTVNTTFGFNFGYGGASGNSDERDQGGNFLGGINFNHSESSTQNMTVSTSYRSQDKHLQGLALSYCDDNEIIPALPYYVEMFGLPDPPRGKVLEDGACSVYTTIDYDQ